MEFSVDKELKELKQKVLRACDAFEVANQECKKLTKENAALRAALTFCKECMAQHIGVELWMEELKKIEEGGGLE